MDRMKEIINNSAFFGVLISIIGYEIGRFLQRRLKLAIFNPLLIAIIVVIGVLVVMKIDYEVYEEGAEYISYLLTPATVCLAVPLYEKLSLLKGNFKAIMLGIFSGVMASAISIFGIALLFGVTKEQYITMLPKSITAAIGMELSMENGGMATITVAAIVITGIFGNLAAEGICRVFRIREPIAKGVAIGTSAHAMGTARAMEIGEIEGAMSGLAIAVAGIMTVVVVPLFAGFW